MNSREIKTFEISSLYFKEIKFTRDVKPIFKKWKQLCVCNIR